MNSELHSSDHEDSINVAAYLHHRVHLGGFATYDYDDHESPAPSFEMIIAYKTIDRVHENTSTMSATAADYIDYPGPTHEDRYVVCSDERTSINSFRFPWNWLVTTKLRSLGLNEVCIANTVHQVRRRSDRFFRSRLRFDSGRVIIPVIVVAVDLRTEFLENEYSNGFRSDSDYESAVARVSDASFLEHQVMTVPASEASVRALEKIKVDDVSDLDGAGLMGLSGTDDNVHPCAICLDDLIVKHECEDREVELIRLPCNHLFHGRCIITWLRTSHICPLCRSEITPVQPSVSGKVYHYLA